MVQIISPPSTVSGPDGVLLLGRERRGSQDGVQSVARASAPVDLHRLDSASTRT